MNTNRFRPNLPLLLLLGSTPAVTTQVFAAPAAQGLPLRDVVLFSSGVGYFGRAGSVAGDQNVQLQFRATQMADILKSLVIADPNGKVGPVTYSIADWLSARPEPSDIKVNVQGGLPGVLQTFQGAEFRIQHGADVVVGRLVSEAQSQVWISTDVGWATTEQATLLTEAGLRNVRIDDATSIALTDPVLDARFRASLAHLAAAFTAATDDGLRTVNLNFTGAGTRPVSAGYLLETPAWKTTYRLIVDPKGKAYLQGWAIVENPTDEDWNGVHLNLVSGQPVSFIQDLYAPIYVARPVVPPLIIGSSQPQTYGAGYGNANAAIMEQAAGQSINGMIVTSPGAVLDSNNQLHANLRENLTLAGAAVISDAPASAASLPAAASATGAAAATGAQRGELFAYTIDAPITIPRGQAAMVPIVGAPIQGEPVTIVTSTGDVAELAPANGFFLRNTTGEHLQGGPFTIYASGIYAGDAMATDIVPGETRLISYANDLEVAARLDHDDEASRITQITALQGVLSQTTRNFVTDYFVIKNKSAKPKTVILQMPVQQGWNLANPGQSFEKSTDGLRFRVGLAPHQLVTYAVPEFNDDAESSNIIDCDVPSLIQLLNQPELSPGLRDKLLGVQTRRNAIWAAQAKRKTLEAQVAAIEADQDRIRGNLAVLTEGNALRTKYETKLALQEPRIESLRQNIAALIQREATLQTDLQNYVDNLSGGVSAPG